MRGRGLKPNKRLYCGIDLVAPHAGAWIETGHNHKARHHTMVAPHAGAWIETVDYRIGVLATDVAPHAGAWIETG